MRNEIKNYLMETGNIIQGSDADILNQITEKLLEAKEHNTEVFIAGNGGSAANANHMATDLLKGLMMNGNPGMKVHSLVESMEVMTCLSNDFSYEDALSIELKNYANNGDILIIFSGSGNSKNIVNAVKYAKEHGIFVIGFLGRDGGLTLQFCDLSIVTNTMDMEMIEDSHLAFIHAIKKAMIDVLLNKTK